MPFVAKSSVTGERIDITLLDGNLVRNLISPSDPICQLCNEPLLIRSAHYRSGYQVSAHFAHRADCNPLYDVHPESPEHLHGKLWLRDYLTQMYGQYVNSIIIDLEFAIDMDWRARGRIADVLVTWPMGWREAHEIQLASITTNQLLERTNDYLRCGIDVTWWLGNNALTRENVEWCVRRFGQCYTVEIGRASDQTGILE